MAHGVKTAIVEQTAQTTRRPMERPAFHHPRGFLVLLPRQCPASKDRVFSADDAAWRCTRVESHSVSLCVELFH